MRYLHMAKVMHTKAYINSKQTNIRRKKLTLAVFCFNIATICIYFSTAYILFLWLRTLTIDVTLRIEIKPTYRN